MDKEIIEKFKALKHLNPQIETVIEYTGDAWFVNTLIIAETADTPIMSLVKDDLNSIYENINDNELDHSVIDTMIAKCTQRIAKNSFPEEYGLNGLVLTVDGVVNEESMSLLESRIDIVGESIYDHLMIGIKEEINNISLWK
tara:strand:- start:1287 stop:1712 length:426 start_codon:yes stop_codon:yes gene_type:complete